MKQALNNYETADCRPTPKDKHFIIKKVFIESQVKEADSFKLSIEDLYSVSTAIHIFWKYLKENNLEDLPEDEREDVEHALKKLPDIERILKICMDFETLEELCSKTFILEQIK